MDRAYSEHELRLILMYFRKPEMSKIRNFFKSLEEKAGENLAVVLPVICKDIQSFSRDNESFSFMYKTLTKVELKTGDYSTTSEENKSRYFENVSLIEESREKICDFLNLIYKLYKEGDKAVLPWEETVSARESGRREPRYTGGEPLPYFTNDEDIARKFCLKDSSEARSIMLEKGVPYYLIGGKLRLYKLSDVLSMLERHKVSPRAENRSNGISRFEPTRQLGKIGEGSPKVEPPKKTYGEGTKNNDTKGRNYEKRGRTDEEKHAPHKQPPASKEEPNFEATREHSFMGDGASLQLVVGSAEPSGNAIKEKTVAEKAESHTEEETKEAESHTEEAEDKAIEEEEAPAGENEESTTEETGETAEDAVPVDKETGKEPTDEEEVYRDEDGNMLPVFKG